MPPLSSPPPLKIAVLGAGLMGRWHAQAARRLGARIVAVVDPDTARAERLVAIGSDAAVFSSAAEMLASGKPDVAHVCTPLTSHVPVVCELIDAGVHVLVEKPLAVSAAQTRDLLDRARARDLLICPVHQFAFQQGIATAIEALKSAGDVYDIAFTICSAGGEGLDDEGLNAVAADILPHPLSVLRVLFPGTGLDVGGWAASSLRPGELLAVGELGGAQCSVSISMHARPTVCGLTLRCANKTIEANFFHGYAAVHGGDVSRVQKIVQPFTHALATLVAAGGNLLRRALRREPAYPGLRSLVERFYAAVQGRGANPISPEDALAVATARDLILEKAFPR